MVLSMLRPVTIGHWILYKTDNTCKVNPKNPADYDVRLLTCLIIACIKGIIEEFHPILMPVDP
jgi:hypothetical protein